MARSFLPSLCLIGLLMVALSAPAGAQSDETFPFYAWTGEIESGAADRVEARFPTPEELSTALARLDLMLKVQRRFDEARDDIDRLWLRVNLVANEVPTARRDQALTAVAARRAEALLTLGRLDEALNATNVLALTRSTPTLGLALVTVPIGEDEFRHRAALRGEARLAEVRSWIEARMSANAQQNALVQQAGAQVDYLREHFGTPSAEIVQHLRASYAAGSDGRTVRSLGKLAAPALAWMVLSDLEPGVEFGDSDPLHRLAQVDPEGACRLALDFLPRTGDAFRQRALNMFTLVSPFTDWERWQYDGPDHPPILLQSYWLNLTAALIQSDRDLAQLDPGLRKLVHYDHLAPVLQKPLIRIVREGTAEQVMPLLRLLEVDRTPPPSAQPILQAAMAHSDPVVRTVAAKALLQFRSDPALLAAADDSEARVRLRVAQALNPREVFGRRYQGDGRFVYQEVPQDLVFDSQAHTTLERLLEDPVADIRRTALDGLLNPHWPTPDQELLKKIITHADTEQAQRLLELPVFSGKDRGRLLLALCHHQNPEVRHLVDFVLVAQAKWEQEAKQFVPPLVARLTDSEVPFEIRLQPGKTGSSDSMAIYKFLLDIVDHPPVAQALLELGLTTEEPVFLEAVMQADSQILIPLLADLGAKNWSKLFWKNATFRFYDMWDLDRAAASIEDLDSVMLRQMLADCDDSSDLNGARWVLIHQLMLRRAPGIESFLLKQLRRFDIETGRRHWEHLHSCRFPKDDRQFDFLEAVIADEEIPTETKRLLLSTMPIWSEDPRRTDMIELFFERWAWGSCIQEKHREVVRQAAEALLQLPLTERRIALLTAAVGEGHSDFGRIILPQISKGRFESLLPAAGAALARNTSPPIQRLALECLKTFVSESAAQQLVRGLDKVTDPRLREDILQALADIRRFQEEKTYWTVDPEARLDTAQAIADLLAMLKDSDAEIRAAATRSLGRFEQPELLPHIVRMLKDPSPKVREAAQEVLDRAPQDQPL